MKKYLFLFSLMLASLIASAQAPIDHTRESRLLMNRATQEKEALIIPMGPEPFFPSYLPADRWQGALFMDTLGTNKGLKRWNGSAWVDVGSDLSDYARKSATNFFNGYNNFQDVGARTVALSSYGPDVLSAGDVSAGNYRVSSLNSGPFIGNTSFRNKVPQYRWGERAGGGAFVVQKYKAGVWVDVLATSGNGDSAFVKRPELDSVANTKASLWTDNYFGGDQSGNSWNISYNHAVFGGIELNTNPGAFGGGFNEISLTNSGSNLKIKFDPGNLPDRLIAQTSSGAKTLAYLSDFVINANNGLTKTPGGDIQLGGELSRFTRIGTNSNILYVGDDNGGLAISPNQYRFYSQNADNADVTNEIGVGTGRTRIQTTYQNLSQGIYIEPSALYGKGIFVKDNLDNRGIQYDADYTANQLSNDRAITDVGGIKALIANAATNFLTYNGATQDLNLKGYAVQSQAGSGGNLSGFRISAVSAAAKFDIYGRNGLIFMSNTGEEIMRLAGTDEQSDAPGIRMQQHVILGKVPLDYDSNYTGYVLVRESAAGGANGIIKKVPINSFARATDTVGFVKKTGATFTGSVYLAHDAVADMEAVTRNQLYNLYNGLSWKSSVRAKAPGNVTLSGIQTIDGVAGLANGRYLLTNQTNAKENGIWLMQSGAWVRSTDADSGEEVTGLTVSISLGSTGTRYSQWTYTGDANPAIGTDNITFSQISGPGTYGAGTGIIANANLFLLDQTFVKNLFSATGPLSYSNGVFSIAQSGINQDGYLSSSDYNIFANKQAAGNYLTALTGEVTAAGPGSAAATINKNITYNWLQQHTFSTQTNFGGSLIPTTNATYSVGNAGGNFLNVYANSFQSNTSITFNTINGNGIVYQIGGIEKLRISPANGNLLLGTTTDDGTSKLQINGQGVITQRFSVNSSLGANIPAALYIGSSALSSSAAFSLNGLGIRQDNLTYTSSATGATIAQAAINNYGVSTLANANATTITKAYGNYFRSPAAGTNTTITNAYSAGFNGDIEVQGQAFFTSNTVVGVGTGALSKFTVYQSSDAATSGIAIANAAGGSSNFRLWVDGANSRLSGNGSETGNIILNGGGSGLLMIGTTTSDGVSRLQVNGQASFTGNIIPSSNRVYTLGSTSQNFLSAYTSEINSVGTAINLNFRLNGTDVGRWFTSSGNLVIGGTTDAGTGKLQVVGSISATTDISILASDRGLILKSPDGTRYRVTIANGGALQTTSI